MIGGGWGRGISPTQPPVDPGEVLHRQPVTLSSAERKHGGMEVCFPSFSRSLFIKLEISASLAAAVGGDTPHPHTPLPHPNDRSHYKINVTKIAHNASEKCNTISGSLSSF